MTTPKTVCIKLNPADNVVVIKRALAAGQKIEEGGIQFTARQNTPFGHKIAIFALADGDPIRKYGQIIGFAQGHIQPGDHVHTHNCVMRDFGRAYEFCADAKLVPVVDFSQMRFFQGYLREDGRTGTRNYLAVISSVNCSASVSRYVAEHFNGPDFKRDYPNIDGVVPITHKSGCALQPGEPHHLLQRVLAGFARHPNVAGCVFIGLGCEVNQLEQLARDHSLDIQRPGESPRSFLNIQSLGGVRKTVAAAVSAIRGLLPAANLACRSPQPISKLVLATNCGGSDGNSGVTANPALGVAADELVRHGGTAVLAETPEIYGAEHLLVRRAVSREVGEKLLERIRWWENYVRIHNATIDNNPTQGNKAGGLTTIYEKSLGAVAKGGHSPLVAVYQYAEPILARGFCFMDTPGYDPVSMTGLVAGGCNIGVFTTGRGSVYGCKPSPCIKVATNSPLYQHMQDDMDLNAGTILEGIETVEMVGRRILEKIISVASGEPTKSELAGIGDEEFAPWILGPTF